MNDGAKEVYLGDGLYASDTHGMFNLRAPRMAEEDSLVHLEPEVLSAFLDYVAKRRNLHIQVTASDGRVQTHGVIDHGF